MPPRWRPWPACPGWPASFRKSVSRPSSGWEGRKPSGSSRSSRPRSPPRDPCRFGPAGPLPTMRRRRSWSAPGCCAAWGSGTPRRPSACPSRSSPCRSTWRLSIPAGSAPCWAAGRRPSSGLRPLSGSRESWRWAASAGSIPMASDVILPPGPAARLPKLSVSNLWDLFRSGPAGIGYSAVHVRLKSPAAAAAVKKDVCGHGLYDLLPGRPVRAGQDGLPPDGHDAGGHRHDRHLRGFAGHRQHHDHVGHGADVRDRHHEGRRGFARGHPADLLLRVGPDRLRRGRRPDWPWAGPSAGPSTRPSITSRPGKACRRWSTSASPSGFVSGRSSSPWRSASWPASIRPAARPGSIRPWP